MASSSAEASGFFDDKCDEARPARPRASNAERRLMDLQRAVKRKLIRKRDIRGALEIATNAIFEVDRMRASWRKISSSDPVERLRQWCDRRDLTIGPRVLSGIIKKWRAADYLMSVEDCGELLSLTPKQRVQNKLWSLGARDETAQQRHRRKELRNADAKARKNLADRVRNAAARRANGSLPRDKWEAIGISAFCRKHSLNRASFDYANKRGRLEEFLTRKGITERPEKLGNCVAVESTYYRATHFPSFAFLPGGRPQGRPANPGAIASLLDRAAAALIVGRAA